MTTSPTETDATRPLADLDDNALEAELARRRSRPVTDLSDDELSTELSRRRSAPAEATEGRRRPLVMLAGAVLLVAAIVVAVLAYRDASALEDEADARDEVAGAATAFAEAYYSFSAEDPTAGRDRVTSLMTDEFAAQYAELFDAGIGQLITQLDATLEADILDVLVSDADGSTAQAVVVADTHATSPSGDFDLTQYTLVAMERVGGDWKVASVLSLAPPVADTSGGAAGTTPADPAGTTETTVAG